MNNDIEAKLQTLRERYIKEPNNRAIITCQAKCLKLALEKRQKTDFTEIKAIFK